jgi:hypothetical protein
MQDIIKIEYEKSKIPESVDSSDNIVDEYFRRILQSKENPCFHNVSLLTSLRDKEDYLRLRWKIPSTKNKAKVLEHRLTRNRTCKILVYPNGTIIMRIAA